MYHDLHNKVYIIFIDHYRRRSGGLEVTSRELGMCLSGRRGQAGRWCAAELRRDARERPGVARAMSGRVGVGAFSCSS